MSKEITISEAKYKTLIEAQAKLEALEQCGVDNWDGWDDALELLEEWENE